MNDHVTADQQALALVAEYRKTPEGSDYVCNDTPPKQPDPECPACVIRALVSTVESQARRIAELEKQVAGIPALLAHTAQAAETAALSLSSQIRDATPPPAPLADLMPAMCHGGNLGNGTMLLTVWAPKDYPIVVGSNYLVSVTQVREGSDETGGSR